MRITGLIVLVGLGLLLSACVSPIPLDKQIAQVEYGTDEKILVAVLDRRRHLLDAETEERKEEKEEEDEPGVLDDMQETAYKRGPGFLGVAHGAFGIPADWSISMIAPQKEDRDKTLAELLRDRIVKGLKSNGWNVVPVDMRKVDEQEAGRLMAAEKADKLLLLVVNKWYFSINLNWVTAFNFDSDTDTHVFDSRRGEIYRKNLSERNVVDEKYDDSPANMIFQAYKEQLDQIFNDPELKTIFSGG
jgi:hypothetical protein